MKKPTVTRASGEVKAAKTRYTPPTIKSLGNVKKLTLKSGSSVDGFGTFA